MMYLSALADPQIRLVFFIVFGCCFVPIFILIMFCFIRLLVRHFKRVSKKGPKNAPKYLEYFGGDDNIINVTKQLSRVTVEVKDLEKVDFNILKEQGIGVMITGNVVKCSSQTFADQIETK